jgi:adenylosuccinate synthase
MWVGVREQRSTTSDGAAVAHRDLEGAATAVRQYPAVSNHTYLVSVGLQAGQHGTDGVSRSAELVFPRSRLASGISTDTEMHGVHHDTAGVVSDQVHLSPYPVEKHPSRGLRVVERQVHSAREVVAGPERYQSDEHVRKPSMPLQRADAGMQAPVTAGNDDGTARVGHQLVGRLFVADPKGHDLGDIAEDTGDSAERVVIGGAGGGIGDQRDDAHAGYLDRLTPLPRSRLGYDEAARAPCRCAKQGLSFCAGDDGIELAEGAHMPAIVIVGAQWGDEGKGKATDLLGGRVGYVVKFNGGNNAGHTVVIGDELFALHLLPSGILTPGCVPVIGNGVVVDLGVLIEELDALDARGIDTSRLLLSANAHLITEYHRTLDKVTERFLGTRKIGTTGRGVGPAYSDKMNRIGIRVQDVFDEKILRQKVEGALDLKNQILVKVYNRRAIDADEIMDELLVHRERIRPLVADTGLVLNQALDRGELVLLEGGQATMLDVDHGTYPFVTSSSATSGGACTGSGIAPTRIERVIAILKAYSTRVGEGPFPSELFDDQGEFLRKSGAEYGTTTGRPRRCGWLDTVVARYATRVNGVTDIVLTKLDILTGLDKVPICVAYDIDGVRHDEMPVNQTDIHHARPIYEELPGWWEDISHARSLNDLPANARAYLRRVEELSGSRISTVGVGAEREATVVINDLV